MTIYVILVEEIYVDSIIQSSHTVFKLLSLFKLFRLSKYINYEFDKFYWSHNISSTSDNYL